MKTCDHKRTLQVLDDHRQHSPVGLWCRDCGSFCLAIDDRWRAPRALAKLREHLQTLAVAVNTSLDKLDREMKRPPSRARGSMIAKIANDLEMTKDGALRFGLGWGWKKISNLRKRWRSLL